MDVGFETIGNATLICHDKRPILVTDPWIVGEAYFGSWTLSHEIPEQQMQSIRSSEYVWLSHGHPDHLSGESLALLRDKKILLPDHVGGRIQQDLLAQGFNVQILPIRSWVQLSDRIRVFCLPDVNQDALLLIDINGKMVANLNDCADHGWGASVRKEIRKYKTSYLLSLSGYGDADMINFHGEDGRLIPPHAASGIPPGAAIAKRCEYFGAKFFLPFSSMHKYQRADSIWADRYTTKLDDHAKGFASKSAELLPAFIGVDCRDGSITRLSPKERVIETKDSKEFGDDWSERLEADEKAKLIAYIRAFSHLGRTLDFVNFRVGGEDNRIEFNRNVYHKGITFEAPKGSIMTAVQYEIFDDLLIGNFMKTTLVGKWDSAGLYPDFSPYVAKYGDNGKAHTANELSQYFEEYRKRDPIAFVRNIFERQVVRPAQSVSSNFLRNQLGADSRVFNLAKNAFWAARKML